MFSGFLRLLQPPKEGEYFKPVKPDRSSLELGRFVTFPDREEQSAAAPSASTSSAASAKGIKKISQSLAWMQHLNESLSELINDFDDVTFSSQGLSSIRMSNGRTVLDFKLLPLKYRKKDSNDLYDLDRYDHTTAYPRTLQSCFQHPRLYV